MISGSLPLLLLALAATVSPEVAELLAHLAHPAPARIDYTEVRFVHLLREPLITHGELEYQAADRLGKRVTAPYRERSTIADGTVTVEREGHAPRRFALARVPELEALLAGFGALLTGDTTRLEADYDARLVAKPPNWTLTLKPRSAELAARVRALVIDGAAAEPRCFALYETDGDADLLLLGERAAAALPTPLTLARIEQACGRLAP
jgi:hypothetical protein